MCDPLFLSFGAWKFHKNPSTLDYECCRSYFSPISFTVANYFYEGILPVVNDLSRNLMFPLRIVGFQDSSRVLDVIKLLNLPRSDVG
jgi:hypothetical protein